MTIARTSKQKWDAINVLHPFHRMWERWNILYNGTSGYCSDKAPSGGGNFGCRRCAAIVGQKLVKK